MVSQATIRYATVSDLPQVVELLLEIRDGMFWKDAMVPDLVQAESWLLRKGCTDPYFAILVADAGEELVGLCGAHLIEHPLAPGVLFLAEWAWYVRPVLRGTGIATALWRQARAWAKERGAVGTVSGRWKHWGTSAWEA